MMNNIKAHVKDTDEIRSKYNLDKNNSKMRIILSDPPNSKNNPYVYACPNIGLLYIAAYLRSHLNNIEIQYIDSNCSLYTHLEKVIAFQPDVYGLSLCSPFSYIGYNLISEVKKKMPSLTIVCGGPHPTAAAEDVLKSSKADICCIGEGEQTFLHLIFALSHNISLSNIEGIAFRDSQGNIRYTAKRPLINKLDYIPFPAWDLIRFSDYPGFRKVKAKPSVPIIAERGCPFNCVFCSNPVWRVHQCKVRLRSPENIALEVKLLYQNGVREIYIISDEMNPNINWAIAVFNTLGSMKLEGLYFQCNLRGRPITNELVVAMQRANCWLCHIGIESSSQRVLNGIHKEVSISDINSALHILNKKGIKVYAFIMLFQIWEKDQILQIESTSEVLGTLLFVIKLRLKSLISFISCGLATPYPGADLYKIAKKYKLILPIRTSLQVITPQSITMRIPGIAPWKIVTIRCLGLFTQFLLSILQPESYNFLTIRQNITQAAFKLRCLFKY